MGPDTDICLQQREKRIKSAGIRPAMPWLREKVGNA